jgi:hypothetical protein
MKGERIMNARKNLWKLFALTMVAALALTVAAMRESSWVQAHNDDGDSQGIVSFPLTSAGLVYGESLQTILINRGPHVISVRALSLDDNGAVVKEEQMVLEPGRTRTFAVSREEVGPDAPPTAVSNNPNRALVRTEMAVRWADVRNVWTTSEVVNNSTGLARYPAGKLATNHNETLVRDTR